MGICSQHCLWCSLPQLAFYRILECLDNLEDLLSVSMVCNAWHFLAHRQAFWSRYLERQHPGYRREDPLPPMAPSYESLARLLNDCTPDRLECTVAMHRDEVLHVAVPETPAGRFFATASKDGTVRLWPLANPDTCYRTLYFNKASLLASLQSGESAEPNRLELVSQFDWTYCQYVEFQPFNPAGTVILISGVKQDADRGEIAIYDIAKDRYLSRAELQPYDVFGCFFDSYHYLSGMFEFNNNNNTGISRVLIHRIRVLTSNERLLLELRNTPEYEPLQEYTGHMAAAVRRLVVAQGVRMCLGVPGRCPFSGGPNQTEASRRQYEFEARLLAERFGAAAANYSRDPAECRCHEKLLLVNRSRYSFLSECVCIRRIRRARPAWIPAYERHLPGFHGDEDLGPEVDPCHLASRSIYAASASSVSASGDSGFDEWEVEVGGHVVGMCLCPDHRFLYVNVRRWRNPQAAASAAAADWGAPVMESLDLDESVEIHVLDLLAWRHYRSVYTGHKGYTPGNQCFFIFLDAGTRLLCSGSEDNKVHVWDKMYGTKLCAFDHQSVVNGCALSASGLLISVSDDRTFKVWSSPRSRRQLMLLAGRSMDEGDKNAH